MAVTSFATGDALAVKLWSKKVSVEALKQTWVFKFMGKDDNSVIQIYDDLQGSPGDRIRVPLRRLLTGNGVQGDATLEGNEEKITYFNADVFINQLRHAVREGGKFTRQLVPFDIREHARLSLQDWWADRIDTWFFNQICGNTNQADTRYTGNQATVASDSDHVLFAGGKGTDASISNTSTCKFSLTLIDVAVEKAKTLAVPIRPIMVNGEQKYVMFLHHFQVTDMRLNTSTGQWLDIQKAAMQGGQVSNNPIYTGALGEYNGVVLHASNRIPGFSAGTALVANKGRIAVLCGAQAAIMAFGRGNGPERYEWVEDYFDYENQFGVAAGCIAGLVKATYNGSDFAAITVRTWAQSHSSNV
jgi:N4-gp56 family major capsid protein